MKQLIKGDIVTFEGEDYLVGAHEFGVLLLKQIEEPQKLAIIGEVEYQAYLDKLETENKNELDLALILEK